MPIPASKHQNRANIVAKHRKQFRFGLLILGLAGAFFGYYSSSFFAQYLTTDLDHPGFRLGTWAAFREILIATFALYGIIIWPTIFAVCFWVLRRGSDAKLAAKVAIWDEEARMSRSAETQRKIADARKRGDI